MSKKTNFNQYENFTDAVGERNENVVLMTHFQYDKSPDNYVAQMFFRFPDGTLKPITEEAYGPTETHAILSLFTYHFGYLRTIDEYEYQIFKQRKPADKVIDIEAEVK